MEKSGLYRERQSADPLTQALFEDNAIQDSCRKDNMGSIKPRDESLAWRESRSRSPSGSAGTAPRRRAFSRLMLFRDLFPHFTFLRLLLIDRACFFECCLKEFCDAFGASDLFSFPLGACACLRRPSAQREGVRAAPPHGRLLPPHLFKTSTRLDLISEFSAFLLQNNLQLFLHFKALSADTEFLPLPRSARLWSAVSCCRIHNAPHHKNAHCKNNRKNRRRTRLACSFRTCMILFLFLGG